MLGVAILSLSLTALAQMPSAPAWHVDVGGIVLREGWDLNGGTEWLAGATVGVDHAVWRGVALRAEAVALRVVQQREDAWLRGFTLGTRMRWGRGRTRPFADVSVGLSHSTTSVPPTGTRFNYLAVIGFGIERHTGPVILGVTGRWLHASNNGRDGRHLNPDVQSLGALISVGWEH